MAEDPQLAMDLFPGERWVTDPRLHGEQLHRGALGCVAIAHKTARGSWHEKVYPVEVAIELLNHYGGREHVFLSAQRFSGPRRIAKLLSFSSLYADLGYYRTGYTGWHPYYVFDLALERLAAEEIPTPTLAISSGQSLYLIWPQRICERPAENSERKELLDWIPGSEEELQAILRWRPTLLCRESFRRFGE